MIVAQAPLRLPLGGGGTDLPSYYSRFGAFFMSAAIDRHVYVSVHRPAADDLIRVKYSRSEEVAEPSDLKHDLVRAALPLLGLERNLEITSMADVPAGTGLGSSGSYTVALLLALHALKGQAIAPGALAEEACRVEIDLAGHPVGKQDQYSASFGGANCYEIDPAGTVRVHPLRMPAGCLPELERRTLLAYLGRVRSSAGVLGRQQRGTESGDEGMIENLHRTKRLAHAAREALERGDLERYGCLLHEHWLNKRRRSRGISDRRIDALYEVARGSGAVGGKVVGAGGGGFLMLLVDPARRQRVADRMAEAGLRLMGFRFEGGGARLLLDGGRRGTGR